MVSVSWTDMFHKRTCFIKARKTGQLTNHAVITQVDGRMNTHALSDYAHVWIFPTRTSCLDRSQSVSVTTCRSPDLLELPPNQFNVDGRVRWKTLLLSHSENLGAAMMVETCRRLRGGHRRRHVFINKLVGSPKKVQTR